MEENLEYAEMLEIPVDTLNVSKKKSRKKRGKDEVISSINERVNLDDYDSAFSEVITDAPDRRYERLFTAHFVAVCLLCAAIFLTNLFLPNSAINTLMRSVFATEAVTPTDARAYSEIKLQPIISENTQDVEVLVAANGTLSFTANCSVYPMCDGTVRSVVKTQDTYSVEIAYTDQFTAVINGLDYVYHSQNDQVKANLPLGYSLGNTEVSVLFYGAGVLISNFTVEENCVVWTV